MVFTTREALILGAKVAATLPLIQHLLQPGETEIIISMPSHHQQTLLRPAATTAAEAAAVCLTATSSLIQGWGTRVVLPHRLLLFLPAAPQYLSNSQVVPMRSGDTRTGPAVTLWSRPSTGLQVCYLSASRATIRSWTVGLQVPPSITIMSALLCLQPTPPVHLSSHPILPCPRPHAPLAAIATAAAPVALPWLVSPW